LTTTGNSHIHAHTQSSKQYFYRPAASFDVKATSQRRLEEERRNHRLSQINDIIYEATCGTKDTGQKCE